MDKERLYRLLEEYFSNTIEPEDCDELLRYIAHTEDDLLAGPIDEILRSKLENELKTGTFQHRQAQRVFDRIKADPRFAKPPARPAQRKWLQVAAAAVLLLLVASGLYVYTSFSRRINTSQNHRLANVEQKNVILPGGNKAVLTLANGNRIVLDDARVGELAKQSGVSIVKSKQGQVVYKAAPRPSMVNIRSNNRIETPKGGEYQLVLPDGTMVWLNSASSLSFPGSFTGARREVKLSGEAYFEVAEDKDKPFDVVVDGVTVQVLGTHFNIASYADDGVMAATVIEGSVRVVKNDRNVILKPGQQAAIAAVSNIINVSQADMATVMAWKNGYFKFDDEGIKSIMKKLSRWYNIDVEYQGDIGNQRFGGTFSRSKNFTELLGYLEKLGKVHFKIDERKVIVSR